MQWHRSRLTTTLFPFALLYIYQRYTWMNHLILDTFGIPVSDWEGVAGCNVKPIAAWMLQGKGRSFWESRTRPEHKSDWYTSSKTLRKGEDNESWCHSPDHHRWLRAPSYRIEKTLDEFWRSVVFQKLNLEWKESTKTYGLSHGLLISPIRLDKSRIASQTMSHTPNDRFFILFRRDSGIDAHSFACHHELFANIFGFQKSPLVQEMLFTPFPSWRSVFGCSDLTVCLHGIENREVVATCMTELAPCIGDGVALVGDVDEQFRGGW